MADCVRPSWPTGPQVGVMTLIIRQCFAIPTSSCERRDGEIDGEGPERAPVGRASERQKRSDLICDRKTSCPPASSFLHGESLHHLRIHLLHPPSSRVSRPTSFLTSYVPPLRRLPCLFRCSWAFSRAEFISSAKYSRLRLRYRPLHLHFLNFSALPISFQSFARIFLPSASRLNALIPLLFVALSVDHVGLTSSDLPFVKFARSHFFASLRHFLPSSPFFLSTY